MTGEGDAEGAGDLGVELVGDRATDVVRLDDLVENGHGGRHAIWSPRSSVLAVRRRRSAGRRRHQRRMAVAAVGPDLGVEGAAAPASTPGGAGRGRDQHDRPMATPVSRPSSAVGGGAPGDVGRAWGSSVAAEAGEQSQGDARPRSARRRTGPTATVRTRSRTWVSVGTTTIWLGPIRYGPSAPSTVQFGK